MTPFISEFTGTALLVLLGDSVVANVVLSRTKGNNSGWIVITFGWAIAVFLGVYVTTGSSEGHLNPAVTLALAWIGKFNWDAVPVYIAAQMSGALFGAILVWLAYRQHFTATQDAAAKLAVFCTAPAIRSAPNNLITEIIGTFVLVFGALHFTKPGQTLGTLDALPVGLLVLGIGLSLGGPTGYAINPARDLGPRIAHFILPIPGKGSSDWKYSWIPVVGPIMGALLAAIAFKYM
ncbi:MAG TPA: MIP/aquaporin family protein [Chitinophagaceae bacterium]|jgi:glycerol uptake facilitator protein